MRRFVVVAVLVFASSLPSACAQNPSADNANTQGNHHQASAITREPTQQATGYAGTTMIVTPGDGAGHIAGAYDPSRDKNVVLFRDEYTVTKDGNLIIGEDVQVRCNEPLALGIGAPSGDRKVQRQMEQDQREQVRLCTKAGFPPDRPSR